MADIPIKLPDFSRRTFVKGAAATAAAAGLFGTSTWLAHESAEAAGEQVSESVAYCWHKTHCQGACGLRCTVRDCDMEAPDRARIVRYVEDHPLSWIGELAQRAELSSSTGYYAALLRLARALMTALVQTANQR